MHIVGFQDVTYVETIESLANIRVHVHVCASGRVRTYVNMQYAFTCVHMFTCIFVHICVHVQGRVLNYYMIFVVGISSTCAYVLTCFRLYMSTCMAMSHICDDALFCDIYSTNHQYCANRNDTDYQHETHNSYIHVYTYMNIKNESVHLSLHNLRLVPAFPWTSSHGGFHDKISFETLVEVSMHKYYVAFTIMMARAP